MTASGAGIAVLNDCSDLTLAPLGADAGALARSAELPLEIEGEAPTGACAPSMRCDQCGVINAAAWQRAPNRVSFVR